MSSFKAIFMVSALGVAVLATGCGQAVPGNVTLKSDKAIVLVDADGASMQLQNGPAEIQFKGNLFKPRFEITSGGKSAEFKIPRKVARGSADSFYLKAEKIEQKVDLQGRTTYELIGTRQELGIDSCYAPGFCYVGCTRYYDGRCYDHGGGGYYPPGYGYSSSCPGSQRVRRTYEDSREFLQVKFLDAETAERDLLGVFDGDRGISSRLVAVDALEPCMVRPY